MALNLWVFSSLYRAFEGIFTVFVLAGVFALILNLPVRLLQRRLRLRRSMAIGAVVAFFLVVVLLVTLLLAPFLLARLVALSAALPDWIDAASLRLDQFDSSVGALGLSLDTDLILDEKIATIKGQVSSLLLSIPSRVLGSVGSFLSLFFLIVLTVFFLIYGGELVRNCLVSWLPEERGVAVLQVLRRNFNSFIFNQLILAVVLAVALAASLFVVGAPFPVLAGTVVGLMGFIPFGAIVGVLGVSLLFMLKSLQLGLTAFAVLIVVDQLIENILPPRLLGKLTGLNPIVILFSVMVGATIANFIGIITAVPIAATIKELLLVPQPVRPQLEEAS
ncbi:AI-2E family transporter [Synechococcus sp. RSCCF101]|uniref:AI-2E family transporter n=1 Tax=Synechococcus sp. RSCCF101 TaxID=2511069 RepID=UPI00177F8B5E